MRPLALYSLVVFAFVIPWEASLVFSGIGTVSKVAGLAAGVLWLASVVHSGRLRRPQTFHVAALFFFGWNIASVLWSIDPARTVGRAGTYVQMAILLLVIWDLCRRPAEVQALLQAYTLGAWVSVLTIVSNYLTGSKVGWERYAATGFNANTIALIFALAIPIAWYLATSARGTWPKRLALANYLYLPAALFAISLTATRFALIASAPGILFALISLGRVRRRFRLMAVVLLLGAIVTVAVWIPASSRTRLGSTAQELAEGDLGGRTPIWKEGLEQLADDPFIGVGGAAFPTAVPSGLSAHNSYLAIFVELGLIGALLFATLLIVVVERTYRLPRHERYLGLALLLSWAIGNMALTWAHSKTTWLIFGAVVALAAVAKPTDDQDHLDAVT